MPQPLTVGAPGYSAYAEARRLLSNLNVGDLPASQALQQMAAALYDPMLRSDPEVLSETLDRCLEDAGYYVSADEVDHHDAAIRAHEPSFWNGAYGWSLEDGSFCLVELAGGQIRIVRSCESALPGQSESVKASWHRAPTRMQDGAVHWDSPESSGWLRFHPENMASVVGLMAPLRCDGAVSLNAGSAVLFQGKKGATSPAGVAQDTPGDPWEGWHGHYAMATQPRPAEPTAWLPYVLMLTGTGSDPEMTWFGKPVEHVARQGNSLRGRIDGGEVFLWLTRDAAGTRQVTACHRHAAQVDFSVGSALLSPRPSIRAASMTASSAVLNPSQLPSVTAGSSYTATLTANASDGTSVPILSVQASSIPKGLTATVNQDGSCTLAGTVQDALGGAVYRLIVQVGTSPSTQAAVLLAILPATQPTSEPLPIQSLFASLGVIGVIAGLITPIAYSAYTRWRDRREAPQETQEEGSRRLAAQRQLAMDMAIAQDIVVRDNKREADLLEVATKAKKAAKEANAAKDAADAAATKADGELTTAKDTLASLQSQKRPSEKSAKEAFDEAIKAAEKTVKDCTKEQKKAADTQADKARDAKAAADHAKTQRENHEDFRKTQEEARNRVRER